MVTGVVWIGPVFDRGGYGTVARNFIKGLYRLGVPLRVTNRGEVHPEIDKPTFRLLRSLQDAEVGHEPAIIIHGEPPLFQLADEYEGLNAKRRIGCSIFETDRIPQSWVDACNRMDEVWVPSKFNLETFSQAGVSPDKLRVIPYGVDTEIFTPSNPSSKPFRFEPWVRDFKILYTLALDYRKGIDLLLEAYLNEFSSRDNVVLVLKVYLPAHFVPDNAHEPVNLEAELLSTVRGKVDLNRDDLPQVVVVDQVLSQESLLGLYLASDAYISTDRANGWGMPCQEMMALGKPTATIDWSGSTEFMNEKNSCLIRPTGRLVPVDERLQRTRSLYRGHMWAEVTVEEVRRVLRTVANNRETREQVAAQAFQDIQAHYTLEKVAQRMVDVLQCPQGVRTSVLERASQTLRRRWEILPAGGTEISRAKDQVSHEEKHRCGIQLFQEGRYDEAAWLLGEALEVKETSERWNDWATTRFACNRAEEAEQGYRRALELNPENKQAATNLGTLLLGLEEFEEAIPLLERSLEGVDAQQRAIVFSLLEQCREKHRMRKEQTARAEIITQRQLLPFQRPLATSQSPPPFREVHRPHSVSPSQAMEEKRVSNGKESLQHTEEKRPTTGVLFCGWVYGGSGYSDENMHVVLNLAQQQMAVQLLPVGAQSDNKNLLSREVQNTLEQLKRQQVDLAQSVFYQCLPAGDFNLQFHARHRVGRTFFETDSLPAGWVERLRAFDEIWAPSQFNRETFAAAGLDERKVRVLPGGIDTARYRPGRKPLKIPKTRRFKFLSVFEWMQRKGPDVLLRAYLTEFKPDEDVVLILKVYALNDPFADLEARLIHFVEREVGLSLEKAPPIVLLNGLIPNANLPRLYATANAFVLPTRGEGFGRPYMEALACGVPVIATRWSGHMDFLHDGNSYLIELDGIVPTPSDVDRELYAGHRWAEPSVDHLRQLMRQVFSNPDEAKHRAARGREEMVQHWDWSVVSQQWVREFQRLLG